MTHWWEQATEVCSAFTVRQAITRVNTFCYSSIWRGDQGEGRWSYWHGWYVCTDIIKESTAPLIQDLSLGVQFCFDGPSVMSGNKSEVDVLLRQNKLLPQAVYL